MQMVSDDFVTSETKLSIGCATNERCQEEWSEHEVNIQAQWACLLSTSEGYFFRSSGRSVILVLPI